MQGTFQLLQAHCKAGKSKTQRRYYRLLVRQFFKVGSVGLRLHSSYLLVMWLRWKSMYLHCIRIDIVRSA